jgi:hypothetical protein
LARADASNYPERKRVTRRRPITLAAGLGVAAGALLFLGYLRVSWTVAATSDGAAQALQARDMLAGNWLLHGWTVSDVSFYATELPEYVLVELARPFGAGVIHVAAAVTYTLLVLGACALARGRAHGTEGLVRGVLAAGIMLAPQLGYGAFVLLLSPDHVGTQVPLLLGWLLLDLAGSSSPGGPTPRVRRWWVPAVLCLLLALVQFADRVALVTAVLPLVVVCGGRGIRPLRDRARADSGSLGALGYSQRSTISVNRDRWYEVALGLAAVGSAGVAWAGARVLAAAGGFGAHPLPFTLAPLRLLWTHARLTGWGVLEVYGANFLGVTGWAGITFAVLHLAGLALAVAGTAVALGRFLRPRGIPGPGLPDLALRARGRPPADLVDSVLAVAIVANLASYVLSIEPGTVVGTGYDAREIAAVLPLGAVLAGRVFGPKLAAALKRAWSIPRPARRFHEISGNVVARQRPTFPDAARGFTDPASALPCAASPHGGIKEPAAAGRFPEMSRRTDARHSRSPGNTTGAEGRVRSGLAVVAVGLVLTGYGIAFGYSAAQPRAVNGDEVLADWLAGHGLRYGLGGASANVVTVDSGGRTGVAPVAVRDGRVRPLLYQSSAAAYDPRQHDATFLITGAPAARAGDAPEAIPAAAVLATFGQPTRMYRFDGFTIEAWNVNLLTKMHG